MQSIKLILLLSICCLLTACKKETEIITQPVVDNYVYNINPEDIYQSNVEKTKEKTSEQYISILYTDLFQTTIPQTSLQNLAEVRQAIGDKQMVDELIINNFINGQSIDIPTNAEMRTDIENFIKTTYIRFFLREPNAYEIFELKKAIEEDDGLTPELIYQSFTLSNEYKFY